MVPREKITLKMGESVQLTEFEDAFELRGFVVEHIEPDPEDPEDTGGAGIQMTIEVGSDIVMPYVDAAPGASYPVVWTDALRLEVVGYDHGGPAVEVLVDRISDEYDGDAVKLSLQKGDSGDIGGTTVRFESHSHKRTSRGQRSPLITKLTYDPEGEQITTYVSLYPPADATWQWRNYEFHLVDWDYGDRIDLEVKRRKLLPVTASP